MGQIAEQDYNDMAGVQRAIQRFEQYAVSHDAEAEPEVAVDRLLLSTVCNPSLGIADGIIKAIGTKHSEYRDAITTCLNLNEILGAPQNSGTVRGNWRLDPGTELGVRSADGRQRYRVVKLLGRGRGGAVYEAVDQLLSSESNESYVALKAYTGLNNDATHSFIDEARRARRISHRNVAKVFDAGHGNGHAYCVSELVPGGSLMDHDCSGMGWKEAARLLAEIADGVAAIHAAGVVHSDIKPSNVVLRGGSTPVIVDFGSSIDSCDSSQRVGAFTLAFCAPEQVTDGATGAMAASDIYSIGSVAVWLLTGEPAAGRDAEDVIRFHMGSCESSIGRTEMLLRKRGVPADFRAIIARATARNPAHRYGSACSVADDLRRLLANKPIEWTAPGPVKQARLRIRRHPIAALFACVAIVGGLAGVVQGHKANYLSREVAEQKALAAAERANAQAERAWKAEAGRRLQQLMTVFHRANERGMREQTLFSLWLLEWTHQDSAVTDPNALDQIWNSRIDVLREVQEQHPGTLLARLADPSLALWLIAAGEAEQALAVAEAAIEHSKPIAAPDDPWLMRLATLRDIAALDADTGDADSRNAIIVSLRVRASAGELDGLPKALRRRVLHTIDPRSH